MIKHNGFYITSTPDTEENAGGRFYQVYADEQCDNEIDNFCLSKAQLADEEELVKQHADNLRKELKQENKMVNNYEIKETIVGLIGEWLDDLTDLDRRENIEFDLPPLVHKLWELEPQYKGLKTQELYNKLVKEIV